MNDKASPGNEYEEEQIVWKIVQGIVHWSRNVWRRGTVPIHWKSKINSAVADADIIISEKPYEDIDVYYTRIMERYNHKPLTIVNLLRAKAVHADEGVLSEVCIPYSSLFFCIFTQCIIYLLSIMRNL